MELASITERTFLIDPAGNRTEQEIEQRIDPLTGTVASVNLALGEKAKAFLGTADVEMLRDFETRSKAGCPFCSAKEKGTRFLPDLVEEGQLRIGKALALPNLFSKCRYDSVVIVVFDVVYHPESLVHALVEYVDGSVKAQLAEPDMRLPIQYALLWDRAPSPAPRFDWTADRTLHFGQIEMARYPCFRVVLETARSEDLAAMIGLSAADEVAVERFLRGEIPFTDIASVLRHGAEVGARQGRSKEPELDEIVAIDAVVRAALAKMPAVA